MISVTVKRLSLADMANVYKRCRLCIAILSVLMQGDLVVNLDNVEEPLSSQTLCTVLTQESFTDRILGVNKTGTAPTLCCCG